MKVANVVTVGLTALLLAGCEPAQTVQRGEVQRFSDVELNGPMPDAYREFLEFVDPFGALYVTTTGGGGGRVGGEPSLEAAKRVALEECQNNNTDRECILYATKTP